MVDCELVWVWGVSGLRVSLVFGVVLPDEFGVVFVWQVIGGWICLLMIVCLRVIVQ